MLRHTAPLCRCLYVVGSRGGARAKGNAGKKTGGNTSKKAGMFKALKKQERRAGVVVTDKTSNKTSKPKRKVAKRPAPVSAEFRNFDERMAAKNARRPTSATGGMSTLKTSVIAPPTFVMAAPTFQFNSNPVPQAPPPREVEGFHGFLSALQAPKDTPVGNVDPAVRKAKVLQPEYRGNNVYALLDDGEEEQTRMMQNAIAAPAFVQPATFTFATAAPSFRLPASMQQQQQPVRVGAAGAEDIDPDL
ncbi:hypothetical protein BBJ28_00003930 [Nothophytophthora sp. Chile5]|nr:hypothetical protein BBJ28_00003930 [Nothophytophthora sp. Chile5]